MVIALSGVHAIRSEIKCMITKSHDHEAGVRFAIMHKSVWFQTKITRHARSAISTLLYSFWNLNFKQFCKTKTVLCLQKTPPWYSPKFRSVATSEHFELSLIKSRKVLPKKWRNLWILWIRSRCSSKAKTLICNIKCKNLICAPNIEGTRVH